MKTFRQGTRLRLSLSWKPPVTYDNPADWGPALANWVDDAKLQDYFWFSRYEVEGDRVFFYMHTEKRKNALAKQLRHDANWIAFVRRFPEAKLEWADDVIGDKK